MISVRPCSLTVFGLFVVFVQSPIPAESVDPSVRAFLVNYCMNCHGPDEQEADFRVDQLRVSETVGDAEYWQLVLDNLHLGEMPPEDEKQPTQKEREAITSWIEAELRRARRVLSGESGEVVLRRLNRTEYEYTIEDLFGVRGDYADGFPADAAAESFDNNGAALMLSSEQITQYIQAADHILNRSIQTGSRPKTRRSVFTLHDFNRESWKRHREQLDKRLKTFDELTPNEQQRTRDLQKALEQNPHDGFSFPVWEDGKLRVPTPEDGPEVDAAIAIKATYGAPDTRRVFSARHAGWYRFKIVAFAAKNDGHPVRLKINYGSFRQGTIPKVADVLYLTEPEPKEYEYRLYLQPNEIVKLQMIDGTNWARREDQIELPGPFVAIRRMEMEGPLFDQWPPAGHRTLMGTRDASSLTDEEMPVVLQELAPRLFRRSVHDSIVQEYLEFYAAARRQNETPLEAFKLTAKAMMASPHFLYHVEPVEQASSALEPSGNRKRKRGETSNPSLTRRVTSLNEPVKKSRHAPDAFALANRLSYFLWRSAPDAELLELAAKGRLSRGGELGRQVDRLLADPRSERFVKDFVGQWLDIKHVGEMQPDGNLYPEYDEELERSMVEETRSFVREILHNNLNLTNLIDSDWAMLNARMAQHYGIPEVQGNHFRRVSLDKTTTVRGGLLTQASILNITSNGTTTSPVVRGVWVLERLLGTNAPPPPPDVPAIEPDIRGASTIQEQLEKHRSIAQCASCHRKIDPYGFALENFDVIGGWRENYRALEPTANPNRPKLIDGPEVVSSDSMPRRGEFQDFREFRELLLQEEELVFKNVARQLATFALGRSMDFADEELLDDIVARTKTAGGGLKTMIRELVTTRIFKKS